MKTLAILVASLLLAGQASAQDVKGDASAGAKVAQAYCSQCHDVSGRAKPQNPPGNAPAFIVLAQDKDRTARKMRSYLMLPHGRMDNVIVTGRDADNVVSYIVSLKHS